MACPNGRNHPKVGEGVGLLLRDVDPGELRAAIAAGATLYVAGRRHPICPDPRHRRPTPEPA